MFERKKNYGNTYDINYFAIYGKRDEREINKAILFHCCKIIDILAKNLLFQRYY